MRVFTIGFTKKTAEEFFGKIRTAGVKRIVDVRLNNVSQLSGFSKRDDLKYFAKTICDVEYLHVPEMAPTKDILDAYKKDGGSWEEYSKAFRSLIESRRIEEDISEELLDHGCLLCSEQQPHHCHRTLIAEYLSEKWGGMEITHLV